MISIFESLRYCDAVMQSDVSATFRNAFARRLETITCAPSFSGDFGTFAHGTRTGREFAMGLRPTHGDESALPRFIDSKWVATRLSTECKRRLVTFNDRSTVNDSAGRIPSFAAVTSRTPSWLPFTIRGLGDNHGELQNEAGKGHSVDCGAGRFDRALELTFRSQTNGHRSGYTLYRPPQSKEECKQRRGLPSGKSFAAGF